MTRNNVSQNTPNKTTTPVPPVPQETAVQKYLRQMQELADIEKKLAEAAQQKRALMLQEKEASATAVKEDIEKDIAGINEAIGEVNAKIEQFNFLGYHYRALSTLALGDGGKPVRASKGSSGNNGTASTIDPSTQYCEHCKMKGHDGRTHRNQAEPKGPLSDEYLASKGLATRAQADAGIFPQRGTANASTTPATPASGTKVHRRHLRQVPLLTR
jgi:hypothetical protein